MGRRFVCLLLFLLCLTACGPKESAPPPGRAPDGSAADAETSGGERWEVIVDWADFIRYDGRTYSGDWHQTTLAEAEIGERLGAVEAGVPQHVYEVPVELPDRSAFLCPIGTELYAVRGRDVTEAIAALVDGTYYLYTAAPARE